LTGSVGVDRYDADGEGITETQLHKFRKIVRDSACDGSFDERYTPDDKFHTPATS
jgi:hypothetical protein